MLKKSILFFICLCLIADISPAYADTILQQKQKLQNQISLNTKVINANREEIDTLDSSIAEIESNLDTVKEKYDNLNIILTEYTNKITSTEENYQSLRNEMLMNDYESSLKDLNTLISFNTTTMSDENTIINNDEKTSKLSELKEELLGLKNTQSELLTMKNVQKETVDLINISYEDLTNKLLERVQLENYLLQENKLSESQITDIKKKLEKEVREKNMYNYLVDRGDTDSQIGLKIVEEAKKYLGVPYVWGGVSPKGMDCSGLVLLVSHAFGINPPRVSADQANFGKKVNLSDIEPGDMLFFDTKLTGSVTHVAIYIGDGKILHAPRTGDVVKISNLTRYYQVSFVTARRFQ